MATKPEHDDGGWAFPQANGGGMSMFEWYSGQALKGLISNPTWNGIALSSFGISGGDAFELAAKISASYAEAMIAEHKRRTA